MEPALKLDTIEALAKCHVGLKQLSDDFLSEGVHLSKRAQFHSLMFKRASGSLMKVEFE